MRGEASHERGAVLLTTLLLMAVMAALTVAVVDDIRYSIRRTQSLQSGEQMVWFERGGEAYAQIWLNNIQANIRANKQVELGQAIREQIPIVFPIDDGVISFALKDARNCFNINQLADPKMQAPSRQEFSRFLRLIDFDAGDADILSARIQDWVDDDSIPNTSGAEGLAYANLTPAYHAANTLMVDISELREIEGVDEDIYQRLLLFVCVGMDTSSNKINLNTLSLIQAPLLALHFGDVETLPVAQAVIAQRPLAGYDTVEQVWALPSVQELELKGAGKDMVDIRTDMIEISLHIRYFEQSRSRKIMFNLAGATGVELVSRRSQ